MRQLVEYFGNWDAPVTDDGVRVPVPVGEPCSWCSYPIDKSSQGKYLHIFGQSVVRQPIHKECDMRSVVGSVKHLTGTCTCYGGEHDEAQTPHERYLDAVATWEHWTGEKRYVKHPRRGRWRRWLRLLQRGMGTLLRRAP